MSCNLPVNFLVVGVVRVKRFHLTVSLQLQYFSLREFLIYSPAVSSFSLLALMQTRPSSLSATCEELTLFLSHFFLPLCSRKMPLSIRTLPETLTVPSPSQALNAADLFF